MSSHCIVRQQDTSLVPLCTPTCRKQNSQNDSVNTHSQRLVLSGNHKPKEPLYYRANTKGQRGQGFPLVTISMTPAYVIIANKRKTKPKELPCCSFSCLLISYTRTQFELEILAGQPCSHKRPGSL